VGSEHDARRKRSTGDRQGAWGQPDRSARSSRGPASRLDDLLTNVARGDELAYEAVYDLTSGWVLGVARKVVRDPAIAEEVMQEVMLEVWRRASRFDPGLGSATAWVMMLAHRRAVDRVRSERSHAEREMRSATAVIDYDEVTEAVEASLERERVQRCLASLTELQRECVSLAYYGGYTYAEVAELLGVPAGTVKTRMRDGLIRLRDCLGIPGVQR
jgi:RNA polymerase sigma-70 factor, ECF subfamily